MCIRDSGKTKKILKRVSSVLITALIAAMVLAVIYFMYCNITGKVAFIGKYAAVKVLTPSMEPTIPAGSYIIAEKTDADSVREGDVIMFYSRDPAIYGKINTHRVVQIVEDTSGRRFVTRGDNNPGNDTSPVYDEDVIGRYVKNAGAMMAFAGFFSSPYVFVLAVIVPSLILVFFSIRDIKKKLREDRYEKLIQEEVEKLKQQDNNLNGKEPTDRVQ